MIRKLDKLIIKAFLGPFAATFFITVVVLVLQFFWLWIDDFVGKGLSVGTILEFIMYQSATLVPLALPLAVLLSSLMTFGNMGETYELVAVKSSGISLLRFMRPLAVLVAIIAVIGFYFGNSVIPITQLKARKLLRAVVFAKPAFDIKEGVFYDQLPGIAIKVGKKQSDTIIRDIIIYENSPNGLQDNFVIASDGIMRLSADKRFLEFILKHGWRYEERTSFGSTASEYVRLGFQEYKKSLDLSVLGMKQPGEGNGGESFRVMSMPQLGHAIDSMQLGFDTLGRRVSQTVFPLSNFERFADSNWSKVPPSPDDKAVLRTLIKDSLRAPVSDRVLARVGMIRANTDALTLATSAQATDLRKYEIEWHRKVVLPLACLVLFFIGAPLGAIIRKGGIGNSLISSIIFFMLFYFVANTGEKFAKEGEWPVFAGMWLATLVLTPIGVFLTYKAVHDSQLFNKEYYGRIWRKIRNRKRTG